MKKCLYEGYVRREKMIFESHAHYDDEAFDEDRESLLISLAGHGIDRVFNVGASLAGCRATLELMEKYPFVYGAMGVHPGETEELSETGIAWLREQCSRDKVVAVGEIGLDYYWKEPEEAVQKRWFERQLELAREVALPVIIHSRDAAKDTLDGFLTLVNRIIWQKPHNCGFFYVKFIKF